MTPIDLHLFARQGAQTQVGFALGTRSVAGNQVPEVIRTSGIAPGLDHVVQARGAQARKLRQGLENERQVGIDRRGTADRPQCGQARLREYAGDTVAMYVQLAGDGADAPALRVVMAQDLRFNLRGQGHGFSCRVGFGESGGAGSPGAPTQARIGDIASSARGHASSVPSVRTEVEQPRPRVGNPDASLLAAGPGNGVAVRRGRDDRASWLGIGSQRHARNVGELGGHTAPCSSGGRDHSGCK